MEATLEVDPVVVRRVYPAEVVLPTGPVLTKALVVVTRERVYVWSEGGTEPVLVFTAEYQPDTSTMPGEHELRRHPLQLVMAENPGSVVLVNRGRGCGCGSPLKSFRPFAADRRSAR